MSSSQTHRHVDQPTEDILKSLIEGRSLPIRELYISMHRIVLETVPDIRYSVDCEDLQIGYGAHQYGYNGWGMAALAPHTRWVSLIFLRGAALDDPEGLLEGTGKSVRHVKLRSLEELSTRGSSIRRLLQEAVSLGGS